MNNTIPLASEQAVLPLAGGKATNLSILMRAGFQVPDGFVVTTQAYKEFITLNRFGRMIIQAIPEGKTALNEDLQEASDKIRKFFRSGAIPPEVVKEVLDAYNQMGSPHVAVRSSSIAEDLPEVSFAGQQDTFLNVTGGDALLQAILECWSSLWTARAIGYRERNGISQEGLSLGVVVQCMVNSDVSGVMFTANPITGLRSEVVIDSTPGLGEALVSGQVDPDNFVVNIVPLSITSRKSGSRSYSIRPKRGGGTLTRQEATTSQPCLSDEQVLELARTGREIEDYFQFPQDIEWALEKDAFFILQSRPITTLYPVPGEATDGALKVYFSFGAVQGMLDPITPFGADILRSFFAKGAGFFGYKVTHSTQTVLVGAGERLWINITPLIRNTVGRRLLRPVFSAVEPTVGQAVNAILDDPRLQPVSHGLSAMAIWRTSRVFLPVLFNIILNLLSPERRRKKIVANGEKILKNLQIDLSALEEDHRERLAKSLSALNEILERKLPLTMLLYVSGVASGMAPIHGLNRLSQSLGPEGHLASPIMPNSGWRDDVLEITRGIPHNPTTEMDLDLWRTARMIRDYPIFRDQFQNSPSAELARAYCSGTMPEPVKGWIDQFVQKYGGRGLAEIDVGRTRWLEDPTPVMEALQSYTKITDETRAPEVVFQQGAIRAEEAIERLCKDLMGVHGGWVKSRAARLAANRVRALMGLREQPKFFIVRLLAILRQSMLESGRSFQKAGVIDQADDLFFLEIEELQRLACGDGGDLRGLILKRREAYQRETLRRQIPRLLLSDGRAFYEGIAGNDLNNEQMMGSPVSPGTVTGKVRIVLDPGKARLDPGEILVCPGTDPSWTPLFLSAGGLVMEVGGLMTHGAVVAREYGIPAIVGVHQATQLLADGEEITINGSTGVIQRIERQKEPEEESV